MLAIFLMVALGCASITGQEFCVRYYEAYCGDCGQPCSDGILDADGSAEAYCSTDSDEEVEDSKYSMCFLDEYEASCDFEIADSNCE